MAGRPPCDWVRALSLGGHTAPQGHLTLPPVPREAVTWRVCCSVRSLWSFLELGDWPLCVGFPGVSLASYTPVQGAQAGVLSSFTGPG